MVRCSVLRKEPQQCVCVCVCVCVSVCVCICKHTNSLCHSVCLSVSPSLFLPPSLPSSLSLNCFHVRSLALVLSILSTSPSLARSPSHSTDRTVELVRTRVRSITCPTPSESIKQHFDEGRPALCTGFAAKYWSNGGQRPVKDQRSGGRRMGNLAWAGPHSHGQVPNRQGGARWGRQFLVPSLNLL
jgi:hypothetical protein